MEAKTGRTSSKLFKIEDEQTDVVPNFWDRRKNEQIYSKAFQERSATKVNSSKPFKIEEKRTELFHIFQD
jgi:hypothetical protein